MGRLNLNRVTVLFFVLAGAHSFAQMSGDQPNGHGTGLDPKSLREEMARNPNRITKVKPNSMAIERKNQELKKQGRPLLDVRSGASREDEIATVRDLSGAASTGTTQEALSGSAVPAQVDNTVLAAFPPIASQGSENSCFPFNMTYYVMSHETCLARGCNNKSGDQSNIFSPRWAYNHLNRGVDQGCCDGRLFETLSRHGAPNLNQLPYVPGDYRRWDLNTNNWISAISNRMNSFAYVNVTTDSGQATAKQMLANGHVMLVGTYIYSFVVKSVGVNPSAPSPFAGQQAVAYLNGQSGGHAMTVAGYDDSIWIDINGNQAVDTGELGAFKVVNSWGTGYANGGFIWVAYDAFRTTSAVAGAPTPRYAFTQDGNFWSGTAKVSYQPKILAKFTVNHLTRNQMGFLLGTSSTSATSMSSSWNPALMQHQGGAYAFDGSTTAIDGTFVMDFSDLVPSGSSSLNYYFRFDDTTSGSPLALKDFRLIDVSRGTEIPFTGSLPRQVDAGNSTIQIAYNFTDGNLPPVANLNGSTQVSGETASVSLDGTSSYDPDGSIAGYSWNFGDGTSQTGGSTATHVYSKAGNFTATMTVTDNKGATASAGYTVSVPDISAPTAPSSLAATLVVVQKAKGRKGSPTYGVRLDWTASTDNVAVTGYRIYRNNALIATVPAAGFTDNGTSVGGGTYNYFVIAVDAAGNASLASNTATISR
jgi:C1A family cysteine protease